MLSSIRQFLIREDGPTAVEYAVMLALIVLAVSGSVGLMAQRTGDLYNGSSNALNAVGF